MVAVVVVVALTLGAGAARAAGFSSSFPGVASVAIVAPGLPDRVLTEAVSRLRAELGVVGLDSHLVPCTDDVAADARACSDARGVRPRSEASGGSARGPEAPGSSGLTAAALTIGTQATATIALAREDGVVTIEVIERLANGSKFFRLVYVPSAEGGNDPSVLAIRGVELLRDVHLDVERTNANAGTQGTTIHAAASELPTTVVREPAPVHEDVDTDLGSPDRPVPLGPWSLTASVGVLQGRSGLGPALGPMLGGEFRLRPKWVLWATLGGPFYEDLHRDVVSVATRQELGVVGARFHFGAGRFRPFATVGVGLHHLSAVGSSPVVTDVDLGSTLWAPLVAGGVGAAYGVSRLIDVVVEGQALVTGPSGSITVRSAEVGRAGAPSLLMLGGIRINLP